jgi:hypothetical protein
VYGQISAKGANVMGNLIDRLMEMPPCPFWIHEKKLHKLLQLPSGPAFGEYHSLTCILSTITNGSAGNKRGGNYMQVDVGYARCEFSSTDHVHYQQNGAAEQFSTGTDGGTSLTNPRWFMFGCRPRFELVVQKAMVNEAIGGASDMDADESKRRRSGYKHFVLGGLTDGGYSNQDVPDLAYRYRDHFRDIITSINDRFVSKHAVERKAFVPAELKEFERLLRLMLVASVDGCGKLRIAERSERGIMQREIVISARAPGQDFPTTQQT